MSEQQSPVLRFGLPAIAIMIAFGLWSSMLGPVASEMHMKADRIESDAKRLSDGADLAVRLGRAERKDRNATGDLIVAFGEVAAPPNENEAGSSLLALINDIREEFGNAIREDTFRQGVGAMIPKTEARRMLGRDGAVQRVTAEYQFVATTEDAIRILGRLEGSPSVDLVTEVRMTKEDGGRIAVSCSMERWALASVRRGA